MNEQKKNQDKVESTQSYEGAPAAAPSAWKRFMSKKWAFPAMYMVAAAIILALMWAYQETGSKSSSPAPDKTATAVSKDGKGATAPNNAVAVNGNLAESLKWPVKDRNEVTVSMPFFDKNASNEARQAAMVEYGETFTPHMGVDLAREDNQAFDVLAAGSGKVTAVEKNPVVGNLVEITHSNGYVTVYQSLGEVKVTKGAEVKAGDVIATSGRNELEKEEGNHVHFEIRSTQDNSPVNPDKVIAEN